MDDSIVFLIDSYFNILPTINGAIMLESNINLIIIDSQMQ